MGGDEHIYGRHPGGLYPPGSHLVAPYQHPIPSEEAYPPPPHGAYPPPSQDRAFELPPQFPPYPPVDPFPPHPPLDPYDHHHHPHHPPPPVDPYDHHHHPHHHHHDHEVEHAPPPHHPPRPALPRGQIVKLHCMANTDFSLAVRHDGVVLAPSNPVDESQQWIKDMSWGTTVKDEKGFPAFALINKATNKALKHATGELQQVLLGDYVPGVMDETLLWTESEDMGKGFKTIRTANNVHLNLDAFKGDKKSGGIKDGTPVILFKWKKQDNQLWKIIPL